MQLNKSDRKAVSAGSQFTALFRKNLTLQRRQVLVTFVQLVIPVGLIALIGGLQILVDRLSKENSSDEPDFYGKVEISRFLPAADANGTALLASPPFFYFSRPPDGTDMGQCTYDNQQAGFLGEVDQTAFPRIPVPSLPETYFPFLLEEPNAEAVNDQLIDVYRQWKVLLNDDGLGPNPDPEEYPFLVNQTYQWYRNREYDNLLPYGAVLFNEYSVDGDNVRLSYTAMAATRYGGLTLSAANSSEGSISILQAAYPDIDRRGNVMNLVHTALANDLLGDPDRQVIIQTFTTGQPQRALITFDLSSIAGLFMYGFVLSLLLPVFIANIVTDKQERIILMMQLSGLRMSIYWLVTYLYDLMLYGLIAGAVYLTSYLFQTRLFTQTSTGLLMLIILVWGHALIAMCFLLSTFFSRARTSTVVGYLIVIIGINVSNILNSTVYLASSPPFWYMLYPPFAFYRAIFIMEDACIDLACFQFDALTKNSEMSTIFWFLVGETVVMALLTVYLQAVLPSEFGVRRSPLFFLEPIFKLFRDKGADATTPPIGDELPAPAGGAVIDIPDALSRASLMGFAEDDDVIEERTRIVNGNVSPNCPLVIARLRKEYEGRYGEARKVAVHDVSLAIEENECFGLLGANGAGKTTLISVITGVFEATAGNAWLAGHSISESLTEAQREIGVCPQFDVFYPELTAEDHLYFFARLKGCKGEAAIVERALHDVGLWEHRLKQARNLSGGMKRRLSLAIAIIGDPRIVIMDEPTTGLDPLTRRQIWEIIEGLKPGRSMILTTHSMEEADVLCTRIGIMSKGRLQCLGTQQHLKAKFGSGYVLTVMSPADKVEEAARFVEAVLPAAKLVEGFAGTQVFRVHKNDFVVSEVFRAFLEQKPPAITDWGLSMATLEDVFVNIMRREH